MKRINIYITEKEEEELDYLSEVLGCKSRAEIVREAIDEFTKQHRKEVDAFASDLIDGEIEPEEPSPEEIFIKDCEKDPIFFAEHAVKILSMDEGPIPFQPWLFQKKLINDIDTYNEIIINQARQVGASTTIHAYILHYFLFSKNKTIFMASHNLKNAIESLDKIKVMISSLPKFMKPELEICNKRKIKYNGNTIIAGSANATCVRGVALDFIFLDNVAFVDDRFIDEIFCTVIPALMTSGNGSKKLILSSCPNGYNIFYRLWMEARVNENNLRPISIPYDLVPGRNKEWAKKEKKRIGPINFQSQHECKFISKKEYVF